MKCLYWAAALVICLTGLFASESFAQDGSYVTGNRYIFNQVKIGSGGYVTGLVIHPDSEDSMYARTDVGGAYRWSTRRNTWLQIVTAQSFPELNGESTSDPGVESIAIAPSNAYYVYVAYRNNIWRSNNLGRTFTKTGPDFELLPNATEMRVHGERMSVDPDRFWRVIFGSRNQGLWYTADGENWQQSNLPAGETDNGVSVAQFAPGETRQQGRNFVDAYAGVVGEGIFYNSDGGRTWTKISGGTNEPENDIEVTDIEIGTDNTAYFTIGERGEDGNGAPGSAWKYRPGSAWGPAGSDWLEITPDDSWSSNFYSVAVDPFNPLRLIISEPGFKVANYSTDGGDTWLELQDGWGSDVGHYDPIRNSPDIPWLLTSGDQWFEHGEITFTPHHPDRLMAAHGGGVWYSDGVADQLSTRTQLEWTTATRGIEELVAMDIVKAPGQKPIMAAMDFTAFKIDNPNLYTAQRNQQGGLNDAWDLSWQPNEPSFIVLSAFKWGVNDSGFTTDGGDTWQVFPSIENETHPENLRWGVTAVSRTSPTFDRSIVWSPSDNSRPYVSNDDGATWNRVAVWPSYSDGSDIETGIWFPFFRAQVLIADPNVAGKFYMYLKADGGLLTQSTDGGNEWEIISNQLPMWGHHAVLRGVPGREGDLWFANGIGEDNPGLWFSSDSGVTFDKLPDVDHAISVAIGKASDATQLPTVFVTGTINGVQGVHRSTDYGDSWRVVGNGWPLGLLDTPCTLEADPDVFGRFFVGFHGTGFAYGRPLTVLQGVALDVSSYAMRMIEEKIVAPIRKAGELLHK